jgi:hypothetical protein
MWKLFPYPPHILYLKYTSKKPKKQKKRVYSRQQTGLVIKIYRFHKAGVFFMGRLMIQFQDTIALLI